MGIVSILTLGPAFEVNAMASAAVEGDADMTVDLAYTITGAKLYFPPNSGSSAGTFAPANTSKGMLSVDAPHVLINLR